MNKTGLPRAKSRGFTLIEIMVVVLIIGLLASIITVSVNNSRTRGRDARRKADLDTIRTAMEMYANQSQTYELTCVPTGAPQEGGWGYFNWLYDGTNCTAGQALVEHGFLSTSPHNPTGVDYMIDTGSARFCLYAHLEQPTLTTAGWDSSSTNPDVEGWHGSGDVANWHTDPNYLMNYRIGNDCS